MLGPSRVCGDRREESEGGNASDDANGIGVRDFFARAPALLAFLTDVRARAAGDEPSLPRSLNDHHHPSPRSCSRIHSFAAPL